MRARALALTLLAVWACSGTPTGPGPAADGPTGSIYINWRASDDWRADGVTDQVIRVSAADGHYEQVATPYYQVSWHFDVDHEGSGLLLQPHGATIGWMPEFDMSQLVEPIQRSQRRSPRISPDLQSIASIIAEQFIPIQFRIMDMRTGIERIIGSYPGNDAGRIDHWFAGGDSLLVSWRGLYGRQEYYVAQADGSGITPFDFPLARYASYLRISPDESRLAISQPKTSYSEGYATDTIQVFDLKRARLIRSIGFPYRVGQIAWSPDGKYLAHIGSEKHFEDGKLTITVLEIIEISTGEHTPLITSQGDRPSWAMHVEWARK